LASPRLPLILALEESSADGATIDPCRRSHPDSKHVRRESSMGAPRIHGEMLKLGTDVSQSTVAKYIVRRRRPPSQTWRTFLANHIGQIAAADFFVVPTATGRLLFALVILAHERRRVVHVAVTEHPTAAWTSQQLREAFPWDGTVRRPLAKPNPSAVLFNEAHTASGSPIATWNWMRSSFWQAQVKIDDFTNVFRWRRGWDSNPHGPFRYKKIRETLCHACQICRECRGAWHALARAGQPRVGFPPKRDGHFSRNTTACFRIERFGDNAGRDVLWRRLWRRTIGSVSEVAVSRSSRVTTEC
jgi:hypothetical protein